MVFNSFAFLIFFPVVLFLYRVLPLKIRWIMLLAASYYFYLSWQPDLIYLIMFTTLVSFFAAIGIEKVKTKSAKKAIMLIAVIACFAVLFFFKYFNFLSTNVTAFLNLIRIPASEFTLNLILPVGISFYTFQTLSYVIDVYRGSLPAEKHFGYYALYVTYFPQLVAGPIERPENLLPQLRLPNKFSAPETAMGLKIMAVGFIKKIAVADQISKYVDTVYNNASASNEALNGFTVLLSTVLFAFQIYCDFSGYTDIAIGCSKIMGLGLMQNFKDPYSGTSIRDFWKRWHISLTSWFTDYVYIPLGGSRVKRSRHYANIFIVFLISGIWHGANWTYIIWGVLHGIYQIVGHLTAKIRANAWTKLGVKEDSLFLRLEKRFVTFMLVCFAWIFFRANSISDLLYLIKTLFTDWKDVNVIASFDSLGMTVVSAITIVFIIVMMNLLDKQIVLRSNVLHEDRGLTLERAGAYIYVCWAIACAWLILLASNSASSFIYFQF